MERYLICYILHVRKIRGIAFAWHGRAIAHQLDAIYLKILEIKPVFLLTTRKFGIAHKTNYD